MLKKDTAICIRAVDYSETSQIVTLFTRNNGKLSAIAKGSKRAKSKFDGPIEIFSYGEIVFSDSNKDKLATLTEFQQRTALSPAAKGLFVLNCCLFAAELLGSVTEEYDAHRQLFDSFVQFLKDIENAEAGPNKSGYVLSLLILFQLNLLKEVGLQPILKSCVNCKRPYQPNRQESFFSHSANGLVCRDCEVSFPDRIKISHKAAEVLSDLNKLPKANYNTLREIEKLLISHFTDTLNKPPKMAKHVL